MTKYLNHTKRHVLDALEVQAPSLYGVDRLSFWRRDTTILDIGAGSGEITGYLQTKYDACVRAFDVLPPALNKWSENSLNRGHEQLVQVEVFDGTHIRAEDNSADVVMFVSVLHHAANNTRALLAEAARVSRKWIVITEDLSIPGQPRVHSVMQPRKQALKQIAISKE